MVVLPIAGLMPFNHPDIPGGLIFAATLLLEIAWLMYLALQPRRSGPWS
jgi:hypothetical protein